MISQKELKELLAYNPETGVFTWRIKIARKININSVAGARSDGGYTAIRINKELYRAHRLVWLYVHGEWPDDQIDHINHIRHDNRLVNLRAVTQKENSRNMGLSKNNKSGVTGVSWNRQVVKWKSKIKVDYITINLGHFDDKFEAICSRKSAENKYGFHKNHGTQ